MTNKEVSDLIVEFKVWYDTTIDTKKTVKQIFWLPFFVEQKEMTIEELKALRKEHPEFDRLLEWVHDVERVRFVSKASRNGAAGISASFGNFYLKSVHGFNDKTGNQGVSDEEITFGSEQPDDKEQLND